MLSLLSLGQFGIEQSTFQWGKMGKNWKKWGALGGLVSLILEFYHFGNQPSKLMDPITEPDLVI